MRLNLLVFLAKSKTFNFQKSVINLLLTLGLFSACSGGTNTALVPTAQKTPTPLLEETFERPLDVDNPTPGCGYGDSPCAANPKETLNIVHAGVDYWGDPKQTYPEDEKRPVIFSSAPGYVVAIIHNEIGCKPPPAKGDCDDHGLGNTVIMKHVLADSREEIYTLYAHLEKIDSSLEENFKSLSEGESLCVDQHTTLGIMGASGYGQQNWWTKLDPPMPHLHLEFKIRGILSNPSGGGTKYGYVSSNPPDDWGYRNPNNYIGKKSALTCYALTNSLAPIPTFTPSVLGVTPIRMLTPTPTPNDESNNGQTEQPTQSWLDKKWSKIKNIIKNWWDEQVQKLQTWWNNQMEKLRTWWAKQLENIQRRLEEWAREQWEAFWRELEAQIIIWLQQCLGVSAIVFLPLVVYLLNNRKYTP